LAEPQSTLLTNVLIATPCAEPEATSAAARGRPPEALPVVPCCHIDA
jgi:hypothetical protein